MSWRPQTTRQTFTSHLSTAASSTTYAPKVLILFPVMSHLSETRYSCVPQVRPDSYSAGARPLADNLYGWSKESYEHLGFLYAVGKETPRRLEVVQIRIGAPQEKTLDTVKSLQAMNRYLGAYLSGRDCTQIFVKSIETEDIRDEHGVPFQVFCASCAPPLHWSLSRHTVEIAPKSGAVLIKHLYTQRSCAHFTLAAQSQHSGPIHECLNVQMGFRATTTAFGRFPMRSESSGTSPKTTHW